MTAQDELVDSGIPPQLDLSISYNNTPIQFAHRPIALQTSRPWDVAIQSRTFPKQDRLKFANALKSREIRSPFRRRNFGFQVKKVFFALFMQYKLMFEVSCGIVRTLNDEP